MAKALRRICQSLSGSLLWISVALTDEEREEGDGEVREILDLPLSGECIEKL